MIIKYYKGYVGTEYLRELTRTDNDGVTAYHIVEALKKLGFDARGIKVKIDEINILPAIAYVTIDNVYNHYVVIYKINKKKQEIIIADPAKKIMKMSFNDFNKIYNNIIIEAIPIKKIPIMKNISVFKFLLSILKKEKRTIVLIIIQSLFITLLAIISSFYFQSLLTNVYDNFIIFYLFLLVQILSLLLQYIKNNTLLKLNSRFDYSMNLDIIKNVITLPYNYFKSRTTGEVITRINDVDSVKNTINMMIITIFVDSILVLIAGLVLFKINHLLFYISLIILIFYAFITIVFHKRFKSKIDAIKDKKEYFNSFVIESINGIETIKGLNLDELFINKMDKLYSSYIRDYIKLDKLINKQFIIKELINSIGIMIILLIGSLFIKKQMLTIGTLFTFINLLNYFLEPIRNIVDLNIDISESINAIRRVLEIDTIRASNGIIEINTIDNIKINNLSYSHNGFNNNIKNINLNINKGEKIMLVGQSGSGKSSLLKILKKYYEIKDNRVFINNIDINKINIVPITYISQNEILFTDTLLNNLKLNRNISDSKVKEIVSKCFINDIMPLNNLIEENGFNLSGGEKQRIILGRTLLSSASFIIIDEALNQVDVNMERKILKNILIDSNLNIIYVSHRTNNMDLFDRVIKLENGSIKEDLKRKD